MGIRFYCPQGHKLNVKSFLAGKIGICPDCKTRVQIPSTSTRPSSRALQQKPGEQNEAALPLASPLEDLDEVLPVAEEVATLDTEQAAPVDAVRLAEAVPTNGVEDALPLSTEDPPVAATVVPSTSNDDPLTVAPHARWYVAHSEQKGQKYGPATGEMMRQWIEEGRVSAEHLVWREGWSEWQLAGVCFPHLNQQTGQG